MGKLQLKKKKKKNKGQEGALRRRYRALGQSGAYGGAGTLLKAVNKGRKRGKYTQSEVKGVLQGEPAYTLHRQVKRKFQRRKTIVSGPFDQFQCDLVDVSAYKNENDGFRFILCVLDVFSRVAWARPLKSKQGKEVTRAFEDILREAGRDPLFLHCDKGSEFLNSDFLSMARKRGIKVFSVHNQETKASLVERFQKTLQGIMHRHFTSTRSRAFLGALKGMLKTYNKTYHRAIGMPPEQVGPANIETVWRRLYGRDRGEKWPVARLTRGEHVRISETRRTFKKGYLPHWTTEIFKIRTVLNTWPPTYTLEDYSGEPIDGSFYEEELQVVKPPTYYDIEEVLGTRTRKGRKEYLVKWLGYPDTFNSWERDIIDVA